MRTEEVVTWHEVHPGWLHTLPWAWSLVPWHRQVWKSVACTDRGRAVSPVRRYRVLLHAVPEANLATYGVRRTWWGALRAIPGSPYRPVIRLHEYDHIPRPSAIDWEVA